MKPEDVKQLGIEAAKKVSNVVNYSGGYGNDSFIQEMSNEHRTLQQSFTRLCLQWLEYIASTDRVDGRNISSKKVAKELHEGFAEVIAKQNNISKEEVLKNWEVYKPSMWLPYI